ncbi:MAG: hypothetical protein KF680_00785 [Cryobacterium sp.]|nr:hypothetical protein [Cryobacterium sp.]
MTAVPMFTKILKAGAILAVVVAVLSAGVGYLVAGMPGLWGGVIGAAASFVFLGFTAASIIVAFRVTKGDLLNPVFFGIVLGGWLLKLGAFLLLLILFAGQSFLDPYVLLVTIIVSVLGSLVIDGWAFMNSRVPYVDEPRVETSQSDES